MQIYVLTLNNSDRYIKIKKYLDLHNIKYIKFIGIDGKKLTQYDINNYTNINFFCKYFCNNSIIGCGLSHIEIWKYISKYPSDDDLNLILEDDTFLNFTLLFKLLNIIYNNINNISNLGIIQLTGYNFYNKQVINLDDKYKLVNSYIHLTLGSYLITNKSANELSKIKLKYHIDYTLNLYKFNNYILIPTIGIQKGWDESNSIKIINHKIINKKNNDLLYYGLNTPIIKIPYTDFNLTFIYIILFLLIILIIILKLHPFLFFIIGIILIEIY